MIASGCMQDKALFSPFFCFGIFDLISEIISVNIFVPCQLGSETVFTRVSRAWILQ